MTSGGQHPAGEGLPHRRPRPPMPYRKTKSLLDELGETEPDEELTPVTRVTAALLLLLLVAGLAAATALVIFNMLG